ncbi:hypothetical protein [Pasteuria penetrans]|nr:hypothetical protein [Pasteuria penetrans]
MGWGLHNYMCLFVLLLYSKELFLGTNFAWVGGDMLSFVVMERV